MAMLNWQGWAANWLGWGGEGVTPPTPPPTGVVPAGSNKRRPKPRKVLVEVDGKVYRVESVDEAEAILTRVVAKVERQIKAKPAEKPRLPKIHVREAPQETEWTDLPKKVEEDLDRLYAEWLANDDEEAVIALFLS